MVYLIDFETCYKIGKTLNLKQRMKTFKNSRETVKLINLICLPEFIIIQDEKDSEIEAELHKRCAKFKITNELFQKTDEVVKIFSEYKKEVKDFKNWIEIYNNSSENIVKKEYSGKYVNIKEYDLEGNLLNTYATFPEVHKGNENILSQVKKALEGTYHKAFNKIWVYGEISEKQLQEKIKLANRWVVRPVKQYSIDGVFIKEFASLKEAELETGIRRSCISNCISGKTKTAGHFLWKN